MIVCFRRLGLLLFLSVCFSGCHSSAALPTDTGCGLRLKVSLTRSFVRIGRPPMRRCIRTVVVSANSICLRSGQSTTGRDWDLNLPRSRFNCARNRMARPSLIWF